jgi:hypothetical protein
MLDKIQNSSSIKWTVVIAVAGIALYLVFTLVR